NLKSLIIMILTPIIGVSIIILTIRGKKILKEISRKKIFGDKYHGQKLGKRILNNPLFLCCSITGLFIIVGGFIASIENANSFNLEIFSLWLIVGIVVISLSFILAAIYAFHSINVGIKTVLKVKATSTEFETMFLQTIKTEIKNGKVNLKKLSKEWGMTLNALNLKIFELLGQGTIEGTIEDDYFIPNIKIEEINKIETQKSYMNIKVPFKTWKERDKRDNKERRAKLKRMGFARIFFTIIFFTPFMVMAFSFYVVFGEILSLIGGIFLLILLLVIIFVPSMVSKHKRKKTEMKSLMMSKVDFRNTMVGMIKNEGKLDMKELSKNFGMHLDALKLKMYNLIGSGKIHGNFENHYFIPTDDPGELIDVLLDTFAKWEGEKVGKIDYNQNNFIDYLKKK
ncbi:MAG: hypothetical protein ACFFC3_11440, partial [Candidatus Odinarchaeota archaeon]